MKRKLITAATAAVLFAAPAFAHGPGNYGDGMMMGPGMMGPGMMGGMMGGYGPGAMGPGMMGPGMMSGAGAAAPGMMGGSWANLTPEQRARISAIQRETARKQWALMGEMREHQFHMHDVLEGDKVNEAEARKAYDAMSAARKQMFENMLTARKRIESELGAK